MLSLESEVHDEVCTVRVAGDLDHANADELRQLAFGALDDGASSLVFDCAELSFLDSSGLNVFVEAYRAAEAKSGTITIRNPAPLVVRLIETTKLDQVLIIEP
jgi:anti-anti-sigma factor